MPIIKKYFFIIVFFSFSIFSHASFWDNYYLHSAYKLYKVQAYQETIKTLKKIQIPTLESHIALANSYYKIQAYKKAIKIYQSIYSTSSAIKQQIYYNLGNSYAMQGNYSKAKIAYKKALQLGKDKHSSINLSTIIFLEDKNSASLGIAHPKSQNASASKSENQDKKDETRDEDSPSSSSGAGGEKQEQKSNQNQKLQETQTQNPHPLSSKVYELINKGYIYEKEPW